MKKLLALLLAMLMAFGMAAVAEEAASTNTALFDTVYNIAFSYTDAEGNTEEKSLDDLTAYSVVDTKDVVRWVVGLAQGDEDLAYAVAELKDGKVRYTTSGTERTFEQTVPEMAGFTTDQLAELFRAVLPAMIDARLPMLPAVALPKTDLSGLAAMLGGEVTEADGVTTTAIDVPAETTSSLLSFLNSMLKSSTEDIPQAKQITGLLDMVESLGMSVALKGEVVDSAAEQTVSLGIYLASEGETSEEPLLILNTYSAENSYTFGVDLPAEDGSTTTLAQMVVTTDPAADTIKASLDGAGLFTLAMDIFKENDLQCCVLNFDVADQTFALEFDYGVQDGMDYYSVNGSAGDAGSFQFEINGAKQDDVYGGDMRMAVNASGQTFNFTASYEQSLGEYDIGDFTMPETVAAVGEITQDEIDATIKPIQDYFTNTFAAEETPAA